MRGEWRVHAVLLFVQATFGAFHVVGKGVIAHLDPLALAGLRVAFSTPLLLLLAHSLERVRPRRADLPMLALLGLLGVFANQVFYIVGLRSTSATTAGILMPSIPVFTMAIALIARIERPSARRMAGVALATVGALVILDPTRLRLADAAAVGTLLILLNCLSYAAYLVLQRPVLLRLPPLTVVAWAFVFGGAATLLVSLPSLVRMRPGELPPAIWIGVAYIVLIPTAVNYALNAWALRRSSPALVAAYTTLQPVATAVLALATLGERPTLPQLAGFALIAAGLAAISRARPQPPVREE